MMPNLSETIPYVSYLSTKEKLYAENFASEHNLKITTPRNLRISEGHKLVIWVTKNYISFQDLNIKNSKPFKLNYSDFKKITSKSSLLKKCFSTKDDGKKVVDLTAGYCLDALEISFIGFSVTAIEKKSWLYEFSMQNLKNISVKNLSEAAKNLKLLNGDSLKLINNFNDFEIAYIDQMFELKSEAKAKKEIQFLRNLKVKEIPLKDFIQPCKKNNIKKIIIKTAINSNLKSLTGLKPSRVIKGKAFKFSIFHI